ncbi:MAG: hypothetical protein J5I92_14170 [Thiogranum sp.]|nr:hypothetical protein [Thiogranum sp.]
MRVDFHPDANQEFQASAGYYNNEVPRLGEAFIAEVERVTEVIQEHPTIGQPLDVISISKVYLLQEGWCKLQAPD